jgi:hypothetical protein
MTGAFKLSHETGDTIEVSAPDIFQLWVRSASGLKDVSIFQADSYHMEGGGGQADLSFHTMTFPVLSTLNSKSMLLESVVSANVIPNP